MRKTWNSILLLALLVAGCDAPDGPNRNQTSAAPEVAHADVQLEFAALPARDHYTTVIPANAQRGAVERAVRAQCAGKDFCKVFGWTDRDYIPTAFPMTDREYEAQVFSYSLNRQTGLDEAAWDCGHYPAAKPRCFEK